MAKFVNLTPHAITLVGDFPRIEPSGSVARLTESVEERPSIAGIPARAKVFGEIQGLPDPEDGTYYIVSALVAQVAWAQGRTDVVAPGDLVRDALGNVVGCACLLVRP